jgi:hypothetical protein
MPSASEGTGPASELSAWHSREPHIIYACVVDAARGHWQPGFLQFSVTLARPYADPAAAHAVVGFRVMPPSGVRWGRGGSQGATRALARGHRAAWLHVGISRGARSRASGDSGHRGICGAHSPWGRRTPGSGRFAPQPAPRPRDTGDRGSHGAKLGGDAATGAVEHAGFKFKLTAFPEASGHLDGR